MTPEGKVKARIDKLLKKFKPHCAYRKPVPGGFGMSELDYYGVMNGKFFAIEAKADWKEPTDRQKACIREFRASGGEVFVIVAVDDENGFAELEKWLSVQLTLNVLEIAS